MKTRFSTKSALLISLLSMLLCVSMFVGSTFAWFTDTASTGVNTIQAGKLDVALEMKDADGNWVTAEGKTLNFVAADGRSEILWEPGCTYELPALRVVNNGNLAVKYKVVITGIQGSAKLNEAIEWTITGAEDGKLTPKATQEVTISGHMKETAGNEYQGLSIDNISITVYATQDTVESDSNGKDYDKNAKYTEVIAGGKNFSGGKHTIAAGITATNPNAIAVKALAGAEVTIEDGTFDGGAGGNNVCVYAGEGTTVIIKDGYFTVGGDANGIGNSVIETYDGNVVIEGGFFWTDYNYRGKYYVLNQNNAHPGTITVKGGTFVNYDPSKGDDNLGGNFVADGYGVVSETKENGDVWYTVVKETVVSNAAEAAEAVKNSGKVVFNNDINLGSTILTVPEGKDVIIDLNGKVASTNTFAEIQKGAKLTIGNGTVSADKRYVFNVDGGEVVVNSGNYTAQECVFALFGGSTLTVNDGTFTSLDNSVISTNGSSAEGCDITVNGGVFNAQISTAGYIACGVYVANKDIVKINAGTFNVTDGVGVLMRAGNTTIGKDVVINLTNTGKMTAGKIGDATIDISTPGYLVVDTRSQYPGLNADFNVINNSTYDIVEYK